MQAYPRPDRGPFVEIVAPIFSVRTKIPDFNLSGNFPESNPRVYSKKPWIVAGVCRSSASSAGNPIGQASLEAARAIAGKSAEALNRPVGGGGGGGGTAGSIVFPGAFFVILSSQV